MCANRLVIHRYFELPAYFSVAKRRGAKQYSFTRQATARKQVAGRRKPSGGRRVSRRAGPSGPDRRRNGQAASVVEVGSRGAFGRAGSREAGLRERGTAGQPARASPRSGPSGRDRRGKPFGASPQRRCQGALRSHAGTSASKHLAPSLRSGIGNSAPTPVPWAGVAHCRHGKQNPAAPECSRVCCARACPRQSHLCGACLSATGIFVNKILWLSGYFFKIW